LQVTVLYLVFKKNYDRDKKPIAGNTTLKVIA